ncbi:peptidoglycan editing factor PgeF [Chryseolinea lacunae]|uniref:Purine nucleoside phosphorylase n=1 Tax=Chryseolinea lacunae TaxID=2801331 RepID=A0ABS1KLL1_9BACT|nr:peptidoglycan editing factor PgeF [Chryseolinea lacunae]MBL0740354.1 peptidoglycan editing factor PgeF [Chryseolinea lacunae]
MKRIQINKLHLWQFDTLTKENGIRHFVTDRSTNENGAEFTLSYSSTPDKDLVRRNRHLLADAMGVADDRLYMPSQIHKTNIVRVTSQTPKETLLDTDALISNERGVCIAVMSADCVPIVLFDRTNNAVGAVHSGWRGTVAHILEKTLHAMHEAFGTTGADLVAGIGPSVSQDAYEVGEEVVTSVHAAFGHESGLMIPQPEAKAKLDLWRANELQLLAFGVAPHNIEISNLCSVKNNVHFFSARKGDAGRFAAGIMLV